MNLSALRYFLEVARCNSIRRASERLHIAASAISRQISALERLWAHGLKIEAELQLVQSDIDDLKELHRGTIRITTVEGITENFLPEVLTNFAKRYPEVLFDIKIASRDKIIDALEQYETELGFVYDFSYHPSIDVMAHYEQPLYA
ncbi:MAG: LysR family transcriptional regulator [Hyphomicrobiales bacterium]|nr:LysR family transcriptional regulator [Hyphomicrobiales bacterium]